MSVEIIKQGDPEKILWTAYFVCKECGCEFADRLINCTLIGKVVPTQRDIYRHACPCCGEMCDTEKRALYGREHE